jgi:hypothetical protein
MRRQSPVASRPLPHLWGASPEGRGTSTTPGAITPKASPAKSTGTAKRGARRAGKSGYPHKGGPRMRQYPSSRYHRRYGHYWVDVLTWLIVSPISYTRYRVVRWRAQRRIHSRSCADRRPSVSHCRENRLVMARAGGHRAQRVSAHVAVVMVARLPRSNVDEEKAVDSLLQDV